MEQGKRRITAIHPLDTIEPTGPIQREKVRFLLHAYGRPLGAIAATARASAAEEILSASQAIAKDRSALWLSDK